MILAPKSAATDGRKVEVIDGRVCLDGRPEADALVVLSSGLVILCHLGEAGEVLLRSGTSGPDRAVTALGWSADGRHLALGTAGGEAAIVTFPDQFFK